MPTFSLAQFLPFVLRFLRFLCFTGCSVVSCVGSLLCVSQILACPLGRQLYLKGGMQRPELSVHGFFSHVNLPWGGVLWRSRGWDHEFSPLLLVEVTCILVTHTVQARWPGRECSIVSLLNAYRHLCRAVAFCF